MNTNYGPNIQFDAYKNTMAVLKCVRDEHTEKLKTQLPSQGFVISFLLEHSYGKLTSPWSAAQSELLKNIFNFTIRYLNNTLATRNNLCLWKISSSPDCSFCLQPESFLHVVAGCNKYLEQGRFTCKHDSALHFIGSSFHCIRDVFIYADIPAYLSPCIITGDLFCPDMLIKTASNCLYVIELKYRSLLKELRPKFKIVNFVNLPISCLGIFGNSCDSFINMCGELKLDYQHRNL